MVAAIVLAFLFAWLKPEWAAHLEIGGEIFLRLLTMVVVPLVMASVMSGILGLGDVRKLGKPGFAAVSYYFLTTILAVTTGVIVVNLIGPGRGVDYDPAAPTEVVSEAETETEGEEKEGEGDGKEAFKFHKDALHISDAAEKDADPDAAKMPESLKNPTEDPPSAWVEANLDGKQVFIPVYEKGEESSPGLWTIFSGLLLMLFSDNLLRSMVETQLLPLIVFSIVFAGMLTTMGERAKHLTGLVEAANDALMSFVMLLMKFAPIGIFCLVTSRFGEAFADGKFGVQFEQLSWYVLTVLTGLGIHALIVLPFLLWFFTKRNPVQFMKDMFDAILTAFSTASSSATLPVTMECAEKKAGVSKRSTEFVLPLGATINMDGTALYEAAAAIFIAQIYVGTHPEFEFGIAQQIMIAVTATLAAIGAAGIPEAGLVTMLIVLTAVNLPVEYLPLILPVDWFLDRFRTATNAFGDSVGSAIVDQTFPEDEKAEAEAEATAALAT
jgi:solute carrier family 1 (neuronal/epithelial high affinity glutamate transporter), member 1